MQACWSWAGDRRELGRTYFPVQIVPIRPLRISFPALNSVQPFHFPLSLSPPPPPPSLLFLSLSLISFSPYPFCVDIAPFFLAFITPPPFLQFALVTKDAGQPFTSKPPRVHRGRHKHAHGKPGTTTRLASGLLTPTGGHFPISTPIAPKERTARRRLHDDPTTTQCR